MRLIVATAYQMLLVDGDEVSVFHEGAGTYYGVTWDAECLMVLARNGNERTTIETFGRDFDHWDSIPLPDVMNVHQAYWDGERLLVANTDRNRVEMYDGCFVRVGCLDWTGAKGDYNHVNSVWDDGVLTYVVEHNGGALSKGVDWENQSKVKGLDRGGCVVGSWRCGTAAHNVFVHGTDLYACDSLESCLVRVDMQTAVKQWSENVKGWYLRGMAFDGETFAVGCSACLPRDNRLDEGDAALAFFDAEMGLKGMMDLEEARQVYEVRCLDRDLAHNGVPWDVSVPACGNDGNKLSRHGCEGDGVCVHCGESIPF